MPIDVGYVSTRPLAPPPGAERASKGIIERLTDMAKKEATPEGAARRVAGHLIPGAGAALTAFDAIKGASHLISQGLARAGVKGIKVDGARKRVSHYFAAGLLGEDTKRARESDVLNKKADDDYWRHQAHLAALPEYKRQNDEYRRNQADGQGAYTLAQLSGVKRGRGSYWGFGANAGSASRAVDRLKVGRGSYWGFGANAGSASRAVDRLKVGRGAYEDASAEPTPSEPVHHGAPLPVYASTRPSFMTPVLAGMRTRSRQMHQGRMPGAPVKASPSVGLMDIGDGDVLEYGLNGPLPGDVIDKFPQPIWNPPPVFQPYVAGMSGYVGKEALYAEKVGRFTSRVRAVPANAEAFVKFKPTSTIFAHHNYGANPFSFKGIYEKALARFDATAARLERQNRAKDETYRNDYQKAVAAAFKWSRLVHPHVSNRDHEQFAQKIALEQLPAPVHIRLDADRHKTAHDYATKVYNERVAMSGKPSVASVRAHVAGKRAFGSVLQRAVQLKAVPFLRKKVRERKLRGIHEAMYETNAARAPPVHARLYPKLKRSERLRRYGPSPTF